MIILKWYLASVYKRNISCRTFTIRFIVIVFDTLTKMKLYIVLAGLLALCAIQGNVASPLPEEDVFGMENFGLKEILEAMRKIFENLAKEVKRVVQDSQGDFTSIVDGGLKAVIESNQEILKELQNLSDEIRQQHVDNLPEGQLKKCIEKYDPIIKKNNEKYLSSVNACAQDARIHLVASADKINGNVKKVRASVEQMIDKLKKCAEENENDIQKAVICAAQKTKGVTEEINQNLSDLRGAIRKEALNVGKTVYNSRKCAVAAVRDAGDDMRRVAEEITECNKDY